MEPGQCVELVDAAVGGRIVGQNVRGDVAVVTDKNNTHAVITACTFL